MKMLDRICWSIARFIQPGVAVLEERTRRLDVWVAQQDAALSRERQVGFDEGWNSGRAALAEDFSDLDADLEGYEPDDPEIPISDVLGGGA